MPLPLEDFLRSELPDRQKQLLAIGRTIREVLLTLPAMFDANAKAWPYTVYEGRAPEVKTSELSQSTNAMVLFMLRVVTGDVESADWKNVALVPPLLARTNRWLRSQSDVAEAAVTPELLKKLKGAADATAGTLRTRIDTNNKTQSGTYGDDDPLTLCWLLESGMTLVDGHVGRVKEVVSEALGSPNTYRLNKPNNSAAPHAFPMLRMVQLHRKLRVGDRDVCPLDMALDWFAARLHLHLSFAAIPDSTFDAPELIFALEGLLICDPYTDGLERVVGRVVEVLREKQEHNPNLRPYRPFVSDERGKALLPLTIEVFNSLLRVVERLAFRGREIPKLELVSSIFARYADWILGQRQDIRLADGHSVTGWNSEHTHTTRLIHVWETSQVLIFLAHYARWLDFQLQREALESANFTVKHTELKGFMPASQAECAAAEANAAHPIYEPLFTRFVLPRKQKGPREPYFSVLLYGPPGTGKTTYAEFIAAHLGMPLITISPSDFIVRGGEMVEARAKAIFRTLELLEDRVILFDEIDRLILDRESQGYRDQNDLFQFMTPSMLPKLANLREKKGCIFVIATNYAERIDSAIKREGRVDVQLLVQLPDLKKRDELIRQQLAVRAVAKYRVDAGVDEVDYASAASNFGLEAIETIKLVKPQRIARVLAADVDKLKTAAQASALLNMKAIAQRAADAFADATTASAGLEVLVRAIKYPAGDVTLDSYKSRMLANEAFRAPKEEFASIQALVQEAGEPTSVDWGITLDGEQS